MGETATIENKFISKVENEEQRLLKIKSQFIERITQLENQNDAFASITAKFKHFHLSDNELLVLKLSFLYHLKPEELDALNEKDIDGNYYSAIGIQFSTEHRGIIPTIQTAIFLIKENMTDWATPYLDLFSMSGSLLKNNLIDIALARGGKPQISCILAPTPEAVSILRGIPYSPDFSTSFPAAKIETQLNWEDMVLSPHTINAVQEIKHWIVFGDGIMANKTFSKHIKPGYRALFYGPSGTGKTLAATLLGKYTDKDVYRIDLSMVVSKYIGETEKNLSSVFNIAEHKNWILFFDEADSLFGKRTGVKTSNDRYANQEVSYLLQRIEDFPGIVILASNLKGNMDKAFTRRFQSIIHFDMPKKEERFQLWTSIFEGVQLANDVDLKWMADQYELSGGVIANVFRYSVLHSHARDTNITKEIILAGIKKEFEKEGRIM